MSPFEKLINRVSVHEAFDKPYKIKKIRTAKEISDDLNRLDSETEDALRRKEMYAFPRMSEYEAGDMRSDMRYNYRTRVNDLSNERQNLRDQEDDINLYFNPDNAELKKQILENALKRTGRPDKDYVNTHAIEKFIENLIKTKTTRDPYLSGLKQIFETKDSKMMVILGISDFAVQPNMKEGNFESNDLMKDRFNCVISISFKPLQGGYSTVTGSNDASRIVATVMEFAFAAFSALEAGLKILYPDFHNHRVNNEGIVISFSGMGNFGGINLQSKTAKEGINKRNRLYSLGWRSFQKQRGIMDLVLQETAHDSVFIKYV